MISEQMLIETREIRNWLAHRREEIPVTIKKIKFPEMDQWSFDNESGYIKHKTGNFFSIIGIHVQTNMGASNQWTQPIIKQPEIGILGIITKEIDGKLYCLMQAKIEPGNLNYIQLSPTLQATKSNYMQVHKGKKPLYLEYFRDKTNNILVDQLQSEQGGRFFKKRNRNIIINVEGEVPVRENFQWMTLEQIVQLLKIDNTVNMDTRTVISGLLLHGKNNDYNDNNELHSFEEIIKWLTYLKTYYELEVNEISLNNLKNWIKAEDRIYHEKNKYFEIIPVRVNIEGREVAKWTQPMIKSKQEGLCAFIVKRINGIFYFLVQGKVECGNFDIVEMAPTVQCLTGNYRETGPGKLPYLDYILDAGQDKIIYDVMQSEEGGRFYHEQNRNMIVEADEALPTDTPDNYIWMTLRQIQKFIMFSNFFNIQARSLIATLVTQEDKYG
jgi:dTDP-4-dehydro-6-deoxy-alpha-D-glucopyranose 2,3-dehydratase